MYRTRAKYATSNVFDTVHHRIQPRNVQYYCTAQHFTPYFRGNDTPIACRVRGYCESIRLPLIAKNPAQLCLRYKDDARHEHGQKARRMTACATKYSTPHKTALYWTHATPGKKYFTTLQSACKLMVQAIPRNETPECVRHQL